MAALLQSADLTEEQFRELEEILEQCREKEHHNHDGTGILG